MEIDYEVGRTFTDELIPFSLEYYLGINPEEEDEFDDEDDDKGDDDEDEDSDDDKKKKVPKSNIFSNLARSLVTPQRGRRTRKREVTNHLNRNANSNEWL